MIYRGITPDSLCMKNINKFETNAEGKPWMGIGFLGGSIQEADTLFYRVLLDVTTRWTNNLRFIMALYFAFFTSPYRIELKKQVSD